MASSSSAAADVSITREQLTKYFHLPITDVAKELGICATMLKKICRKNGIPRWPHRKIKSLNKMIESLEASLPNDGSEAGECIRQEIIILKNKKSLIMRNPSILVQGNSNKRSADGEDAQSSKKARPDTIQTPVTTFNNPKSTLATSSTPNSFSINQLLTPPSTFTPLTSSALVGATDEKDYRAFAHHPHLLSSIPHFPSDPTRPESKHPMDNRAPYPTPLTSYLPSEDETRHLEGAHLLHPPSSDPYFLHKAMAYQYHYPRQIPLSYLPPPHVLATPHIARNPYYPFGVPQESPRQQQQHLIANDAHASEHQAQQHVGEGGEGQRGAQQQQAQQQQTTSTQQQTTSQQQAQQQIQQQQMPAKQHVATRQATLAQPATQSGEALPKIDMYKFSRPPSPSSHPPPPSYPPSGSLESFYFSQMQQQQRPQHQ